jgi:hypothetical protein
MDSLGVTVMISADAPLQAKITWDSVIGRHYNVRRSEILSPRRADYRVVNQSVLTATDKTITYTDNSLGSTTTWFYLIEVLPP